MLYAALASGFVSWP